LLYSPCVRIVVATKSPSNTKKAPISCTKTEQFFYVLRKFKGLPLLQPNQSKLGTQKMKGFLELQLTSHIEKLLSLQYPSIQLLLIPLRNYYEKQYDLQTSDMLWATQ